MKPNLVIALVDVTLDNIIKIITNPFVIGFIFIFIILFTYLLFAIIYFHRRGIKKQADIGYNNIRIYSIHYDENLVYAVDKRNMSHPRKETLEWFYNSFTPDDKLRIITWFNAIQKEDHVAPNHLEVYVKIKNVKTPVFAIINVTSNNYEKKIIHLESRLFPDLKKFKKKNRNSKNYLKRYTEMPAVLNAHISSPRTIFIIKLFTNSDLDKTNTNINHIITTLLLSRLSKNLSSNRYMCLLKSNEIAIVDLEINTRNEAIAQCISIKEEVKKTMFLGSISNNTTFTIGAIQEKHAVESFEQLTKIAREMAIYAHNSNSQESFMLYDESQQIATKEAIDKIISDIKSTIDHRLFSCKYVPILNTKNGELLGYDCSLSSSSIISIPDMQDYALNYGFIEDLIVGLYREINRANKENKPEKDIFLTLTIKPIHYQAIINAHKKVRTPSNSETLFVLLDEDIETELVTSSSFISELKQAKLKVGLELTSTTLSLQSDIMEQFDYIYLQESTFKDVLTGPDSVFFKDMVTRLKGYPGKIIATGVSSQQMIELFKTSDINIISSKLFGEKEKEYPQFDKKKINKLLMINNGD